MSHSSALIARLESQVDILQTELSYIHKILVKVGFPEGIKTLKMTVEELLEDTLESDQYKPTFEG